VTLEATTDVTFDDFGLRRPVVGAILAVSDPIHLEVQATLRPTADGTQPPERGRLPEIGSPTSLVPPCALGCTGWCRLR